MAELTAVVLKEMCNELQFLTSDVWFYTEQT